MVSTSETSINALSTYLDLGSSGNWSYRSDYANFGSTEEMQTNSKKPYLSVIELTGYNSDGLFSTVFLPIFDFNTSNI